MLSSDKMSPHKALLSPTIKVSSSIVSIESHGPNDSA